MFKRIISAAAALAVCASLLGGCSKNKDGGNTDLTIEEFNEDLALLRDVTPLPAGSLTKEGRTLSEDDVLELRALFAERETALAEETEEQRTEVKWRDWTKYSDGFAMSRLGNSEAVLYDMLNEVCKKYLNDPTHFVFWNNKGYISLGEVNYADLGLTFKQAHEVFEWFRYNNPQYYFLESCAHSDSDLYLVIFDFVMKLSDPARSTNELFDKLDKWVAECDSEKTVLEKITCANKMICENTVYSSAPRPDGKDQSLYSVLVTGEAVCTGYALTFTAMANAMDIEAYTVTGSAHVWNAAKFENGKFYYVDVFQNDEAEGYSDIFIGVGADYATYCDNGRSTHTAYGRAADLIPTVPAVNYEGSDNIGTLSGPVLRLGGSGSRVVRLEWDEIENAEKYEIMVYSETMIYSNSSTSDNYMYVSFPEKSSSIMVKVRAAGTENGKRVYSAYTETAVSLLPSENKPEMPRNVRVENDGGITISWDKYKKADGWLVIAYSDDGSFTRSWMRYSLKKNQLNIGWESSWQPETDTYFSVMSIQKNGDTEKYSDPVLIKYNINDGAVILSDDNGAGSGGEGNSNYVTKEYGNGIYVGEIENDKMNGHGKLSMTNGDIYEGEWKDDTLIKGTITNHLSNGMYIYESEEFIDDKMNGKSTLTIRYNNGDVSILSGTAQNGVISGKGTLSITSSEGYSSVYEGVLTDGVPDGEGVKTTSYDNGTSTEENGVFIDGIITKGEITDTLSNGVYIYESEDFINGLMNGESTRTIRYNSGDVSIMKGIATDGEINGEGTLDYTYASQTRFRYEGELSNSEMYGEGTKTTYYTDGSYLVESGTFNIGLYNGTYIHYNRDDSIRIERTYVNGKAT